MKKVQLLLSTTLISSTLFLCGCGETMPEDIVKWKNNGNVEKLVATTADERQFMRIDSIAALSELKAKSALPSLIALFSDADPVIVHEAIKATIAIGGPETEAPLIKALAFTTNPARLMSAKALGEMKSKKAIPALSKALNDRVEEIAITAATSLGQIRDPEAIEALAKRYKTGSVPERVACITSIKQIGTKAAITPLMTAMSDISDFVRPVAIEGLSDLGSIAAPSGLKALRSENNKERGSGVTILTAINAIPTSGEDLIWFKLASLTSGERTKIIPEEVEKLAQIRSGREALIEAVMYKSESVHTYAMDTLEEIGSAMAPQLIEAAKNKTTGDAAAWYKGRSKWAGSSTHELELWAAMTALNPRFTINKFTQNTLASNPKKTTSILKSDKFKLSHELTPLLISQFKTVSAENKSEIKLEIECQQLAMKHLIANPEISTIPLLAALNDDDLSIAALAGQTLVKIGDERGSPAIISDFKARLDRGTELYKTVYQDVMLTLEDPEAMELLQKIRPNIGTALKTFRMTYPDTHVSNIPLPSAKLHPTAEAFRLSYRNKSGKSKELKLVFRLKDGIWFPYPALPTVLP